MGNRLGNASLTKLRLTPVLEKGHCLLELPLLGLKWWGLSIPNWLSHWTQPAQRRADPGGTVCCPHSPRLKAACLHVHRPGLHTQVHSVMAASGGVDIRAVSK